MEKHVLGVSVDTGFCWVKSVGALFDGITVQNIGEAFLRKKKDLFRSYFSGLEVVPPFAKGRIQLSPFPGVSGEDAPLLNPVGWMFHQTELIYSFPEYYQYIFQAIADVLQASGELFEEGEHITVFLSLALAHKHLSYKNLILGELKNQEFYDLHIQNGLHVTVSFANVEVESQLLWPIVDGTFRFKNETLVQDKSFVEGVNGIVDSGSLTFQSGICVNNMVLRRPVSEEIGSWGIVREHFVPKVKARLRENGLRTGSLKDVQYMRFYEEKKVKIGKHEEVDVSDLVEEVVAMFMQQRFRLLETSLEPGMELRNIYLIGGDAFNNKPYFEKQFNQEIMGKVLVGVDDDGKEDPVFRVAEGGYKAALRRYLEQWETAMQR